MFRREPALVIGSIVTVLVSFFAHWRGEDVEGVLAQAAALIASFVAVRARVTPYVRRVLEEVRRGDNV